MVSLLGWLVLVPLWWCHEAGRYAAARIARSPASVHWWGVRITASRPRRAIAALGGTIASYLVCATLAFAFTELHGIVDASDARYQVGEVRAGFDSMDKLAPGDVILAVDHEPLHADRGPTLVDRVNAAGGRPIVLTIDRDGVERDVTIQPKQASDATGQTKWLLGIQPLSWRARIHDVGVSLRSGLRYPVVQLGVIVTDLTRDTERSDPSGPKHILDEYQRAGPDYSWLAAATLLALYALVLLVVVDVVRIVPRYASPT